jgi:hypothetical protein
MAKYEGSNGQLSSITSEGIKACTFRAYAVRVLAFVSLAKA